jgi:NAD(P)-dependent dehydrogenase (short-subunit alcohol dehydrogenase family)
MRVLITGATDGLGRALALRLARDGASLVLHGRDAGRLSGIATEVEAAGAPKPVTVLADLASLAQVRDAATAVADATDRLDVLVNNAGVGSGEPDGRTRRESTDGYELRFAVNYLAGFLLTLRLLPLLRTRDAGEGPARVVNVASIGQHPLDFDDLMLRHDYSGQRAYGQSKLAQIMSGFTLAARLPPTQVTVNSLHPSTYMPTKMVVQEIGYHIDSVEDGVAATYRLVAESGLAGTTGRFFDRTREATANRQAYDESARARLWKASLDLVDEPEPTR